nr:RNA-directed DNA polymerase, eukaryota [Tanacetum cinerariifolium]
MEDFIPMGSKEEAERIKRKGLNLKQESAKKQKTSEEVPEEAMSPEEVPEEKVKEMMQIVPIEEVYVEALQVKHPIIDWKGTLKSTMEISEGDSQQQTTYSYKLQVENYSQMANDLILKIYKIANTLRRQEQLPNASEERCHCQKKSEATARKIALPKVSLVRSLTNKFFQAPHDPSVLELFINRLNHSSCSFFIYFLPKCLWQILHPDSLKNISKSSPNIIESTVTEFVEFIDTHQFVLLVFVLIYEASRIRLVIISMNYDPIQMLVVMPLDNLKLCNGKYSVFGVYITSRFSVDSKSIELLMLSTLLWPSLLKFHKFGLSYHPLDMQGSFPALLLLDRRFDPTEGSSSSSSSFQRLFKGIKVDNSLTLSYLFYADDAVFIGKLDKANVVTIVHMLKCFFLASGLKINILKSKLMGVGIFYDEVTAAANMIRCYTFSTPFKYLGVKKVGNGDHTLFWEDPWITNSPFRETYLRMYDLENVKHASIADKLNVVSFIDSFRRGPCKGLEENNNSTLLILLLLLFFLTPSTDGCGPLNQQRAKVKEIKESKDLTSLSLDELIGNLKVHEMIIKKDYEIVKAKGERRSFALKAKKESSNEECSTSGSEDEEYTMAVRSFNKFFKRRRRERKCVRCGDPNHLIGECLKPPKDQNKRAFIGGSWSNSGEEDDEKAKDKTCLMAQASNEACSDSSYFRDESSSIHDFTLDINMINCEKLLEIV